jgi:hypothetical protein
LVSNLKFKLKHQISQRDRAETDCRVAQLRSAGRERIKALRDVIEAERRDSVTKRNPLNLRGPAGSFVSAA